MDERGWWGGGGGVLNLIDQGWFSGTEHLVKVKGGDGADDTSVRLLGGGMGTM
jgi:hypothetical protein